METPKRRKLEQPEPDDGETEDFVLPGERPDKMTDEELEASSIGEPTPPETPMTGEKIPYAQIVITDESFRDAAARMMGLVARSHGLPIEEVARSFPFEGVVDQDGGINFRFVMDGEEKGSLRIPEGYWSLRQ